MGFLSTPCKPCGTTRQVDNTICPTVTGRSATSRGVPRAGRSSPPRADADEHDQSEHHRHDEAAVHLLALQPNPVDIDERADAWLALTEERAADDITDHCETGDVRSVPDRERQDRSRGG